MKAMTDEQEKKMFEEMDNQVAYEGYTTKQLKQAFEKVQNKTNWKLPVYGIVLGTDIAITKAAIIFYTGSIPKFTPKGIKFKSDGVEKEWNVVEADGYYEAIGA